MSVLDEVLRAAGAACYPHEDGWRALAVDDGRRSRLLPQFAWRASHTRVAHEWLADLARAGVASVALFSPIGSARDRYVEVPVADAATRIELIAQTSPSLSVFDSRHGVGLLGDPAFQNLDAVTLMGREGGDHIVVTHWSRGNGPSLGPQHDSAARGEHLPLALGIAQVGARVTAKPRATCYAQSSTPRWPSCLQELGRWADEPRTTRHCTSTLSSAPRSRR